jgi:hypothetical protein
MRSAARSGAGRQRDHLTRWTIRQSWSGVLGRRLYAVGSAAARALGTRSPSGGPSRPRRLSSPHVSVLETILYFVVPSAALYLGIVLLVVAPRMARRPRYRVGQPWPHAPMWWTANPEGAHLSAPGHDTADSAHGADSVAVTGARAHAERGGARGSW